MSFRRNLIVGLLATCLPLSLAAQNRLAYVIGNARFGGPTLDQPAKDAVAVSRALFGLGFDVVRRENTNASELVLGNRAARTVALYYSGRTEATEDGDVLLRGAQLGQSATAGWPLLKTARAFRDAGADEVLVFVDTCQAEGDTLAPLAEDAALDGIFLAMSHDPSLGCVADADTDQDTARFAERVQLALATPNATLTDAFDAATGPGWVRSALNGPIYLWPQESQNRTALPKDALAVLEKLPQGERDRMRDVWTRAGLLDESGQIIARRSTAVAPVTILVSPEASSSGVTIVAPVAAPVSPVIPKSAPGGTRVAGRISPTQPAAVRRASTGSGGVQIFNPVVRGPVESALPTAAGLPQPYIIVGEIRATNASFDPTETGDVTGTAVDTSSFEARNQMRGSDPDLYAELVSGGAFDPADGTARGLARAIQTELARMSCYTSGIDGIWGNGSRGSVDRYFAQISEPPTGREPTLDLYRKIILNDDVTCPVVRQAAAPTRATGSANTTRRNTAPAARSQPRAAQPARRQAPASSGGINPNALGSGVFR